MRISKLTNREERIFLFYKFYLFKWSFNDITNYLKDSKVFSSEEEEAIFTIISSKQSLEEKIINNLTPGWSWERVNILEKAILLNGVAEIVLFFNKKNIVINESVEFTKKYCQKDAASLINAILDKIS